MIRSLWNNQNLANEEAGRVLGNEIEEVKEDHGPKKYKPLDIGNIKFGLGALPSLSYTQPKVPIVPIHEDPENRRFTTIDQAMEVVLRHIIKYHGELKRTLAHQYENQVEVLDVSEGHYVSLGSVENRFFNQSYTRVSRRLGRFAQESEATSNESQKKKARVRIHR